MPSRRADIYRPLRRWRHSENHDHKLSINPRWSDRPGWGEAATVHRVRAGPGRSGAFADAWSRLPERWAVALWRVEPDLERDRDSHQHATQHNDLGRCHCPWPCEPSYYPTRRVTSSPDNDSTIAAVRPPVTARNTSSLVVYYIALTPNSRVALSVF